MGSAGASPWELCRLAWGLKGHREGPGRDQPQPGAGGGAVGSTCCGGGSPSLQARFRHPEALCLPPLPLSTTCSPETPPARPTAPVLPTAHGPWLAPPPVSSFVPPPCATKPHSLLCW